MTNETLEIVALLVTNALRTQPAPGIDPLTVWVRGRAAAEAFSAGKEAWLRKA
jgi:hypothetical protein